VIERFGQEVRAAFRRNIRSRYMAQHVADRPYVETGLTAILLRLHPSWARRSAAERPAQGWFEVFWRFGLPESMD
jgi:hypothetical protein